MNPESQDDTEPFDPSTDPLGIGVQSRASDARWRNILTGQGPTQGPLPDSKWEGFFQALQEHGVNRLVGGPSQAELDLEKQTGRFQTLPNQSLGSTSLTSQIDPRRLSRNRGGSF